MGAVVAQASKTIAMPRTVDPRGFKQGMRALAGAVAILATEDPDHGCCGLTATAICSLSADPPCLLVCLNQKSSMAAIIRQGAPFSINLPATDQEHVARAFGGMTTAKGIARFSAGSWVRGESGAPRLVGARAVFECLVDDVIQRASHLIVIGRVLAVALDREGRDPLVYADGRFATARTP
jgi:flavin reductase (DIM6/NTAB) family NADH-FMN oxidoreductase RutF